MRRLALVLLIPLLVSACAPRLDRSTLPSATTARGVVERYYLLQAAGLAGESRSLLATVTAERYGPVNDEDFAHRGLEDLKVGEPETLTAEELAVRDPGLRRFLAASRLVVDFVQQRDGPTSHPGPQKRFVTVGRTAPDADWVILEIGTGP